MTDWGRIHAIFHPQQLRNGNQFTNCFRRKGDILRSRSFPETNLFATFAANTTAMCSPTGFTMSHGTIRFLCHGRIPHYSGWAASLTQIDTRAAITRAAAITGSGYVSAFLGRRLGFRVARSSLRRWNAALIRRECWGSLDPGRQLKCVVNLPFLSHGQGGLGPWFPGRPIGAIMSMK